MDNSKRPARPSYDSHNDNRERIRNRSNSPDNQRHQKYASEKTKMQPSETRWDDPINKFSDVNCQITSHFSHILSRIINLKRLRSIERLPTDLISFPGSNGTVLIDLMDSKRLISRSWPNKILKKTSIINTLWLTCKSSRYIIIEHFLYY